MKMSPKFIAEIENKFGKISKVSFSLVFQIWAWNTI